MTKEQYIEKVSADERVAQNIIAVISIFERLQLNYAVFGSCGIQTYFDTFYRLPNDLDVIVRADAVSSLQAYCTANEHEFNVELGRSKININGFPVHVIPGWFSVVDKAGTTICARIDLRGFILNSAVRRVILPCAATAPSINAVSLEMCLFLDLIRTLNTNSLMTLYFVFRTLDINREVFKHILDDNHAFVGTIHRRLDECSLKLSELSYFPKDGIEFVQNRIERFRVLLDATNQN